MKTLIIVLGVFAILMGVRSLWLTYMWDRIINAIHLYNLDHIRSGVNARISYGVIYPSWKVVFKIWDWRKTLIISKNNLELIKPYLGKNEKDILNENGGNLTL